MGRAEDLFARLKAEGARAVKQLIDDAQTENLWLDFKRSGNDGKGRKLHESDWKNLSKALSGFGNSDGGVILWGVDCAFDPVLGDLPTGTAPVENPKRFASWLENAVSACTVPAIIGAESIPIADGPDTGYVATLVPSSAFAPHQCVKPAGTSQYYIRAGSNFMPTPHAVLAGMFGRRPQPKVFQTYQGTAVLNAQRTKLRLDVFVHIYNEGPAIARDIFMNVLLGVPGGGSTGTFQPDPNETGHWITQVEFGVLASAMSNQAYRIAPHNFVRVFQIHLEIGEPFTSDYGLKIIVGCEGSPMHVADVTYSVAEVQRRYQSALKLLLEKKTNAANSVIEMFFPS